MTYCYKTLRALAALLLFCLAPASLHAEDMAHLEIRVAQNDTLIGLAGKLLARPAEWPRLQALNKIADPQRLKPGSTLKIPLAMLRAETLQARVESVSGDVRGPRGRLQAGDSLGVNELLSTGANSYAVIVLPDESRLRVQPDSQTRIEQLQRLTGAGSQQSRIEVSRGRVETGVKPQRGPAARYEIRTPTAVIGVRGTEFRAGFDGKAARIEVTEGRVAANQDTPLAAGEGAIADAQGLRTEKLLPAPATSGIPALLERPLLRLPMPETPGARAHRVIVAGAGGFDQPAAEQIVSGPEARIAGLPDGEYRVRLRAISAEGLEGQDSETGFRLKVRPEPPFISPALSGGKFQNKNLNFNWTQQTEAARYRIQIAGAAGFTQPVFQADDLDKTALSVTLPPGDYQWRLASVRANGDRGPWGDAVPFTVKAPPAPPEPAVIDNDQISFTWPGEAGQSYEIALARDLVFSQIVSEHKTQEPHLRLPKPEAGEYFMRVRATDPDGFVGQWSSPQRFVIEPRQPWWLLALPVLLFAL